MGEQILPVGHHQHTLGLGVILHDLLGQVILHAAVALMPRPKPGDLAGPALMAVPVVEGQLAVQNGTENFFADVQVLVGEKELQAAGL